MIVGMRYLHDMHCINNRNVDELSKLRCVTRLSNSDCFNRRADGGGPFCGLSSGPESTGKGGNNQSSMPWTYNQGTASGGTACGRRESGKPIDGIAD